MAGPGFPWQRQSAARQRGTESPGCAGWRRGSARDMPTCTTPQPRMMTPMARMQEKIKSDRLLTMLSGSPAAIGSEGARHIRSVPALPNGTICGDALFCVWGEVFAFGCFFNQIPPFSMISMLVQRSKGEVQILRAVQAYRDYEHRGRLRRPASAWILGCLHQIVLFIDHWRLTRAAEQWHSGCPASAPRPGS